MTDYLEEYVKEAAPPVSDQYHILQRNALQEVVKLSSKTVSPAVSQIESLYAKDRKLAEEQSVETRNDMESRFQIRSEEIRKKQDHQWIETEANHKEEQNRIKRDARAEQDTVRSKADDKVQKAKRKCEEDILLAETERDAAIQNANRERQHIEKAVPAGTERLNEMSEQAEHLLKLYRYPAPSPRDDIPEEAPDDTPPMKNPDAVFRNQLKSSRNDLNTLGDLALPQLFVGIKPWVYLMLLCVAGIGTVWLVGQLELWPLPSFYVTGPVALGVMLILGILLGNILFKKARLQIHAVYEPFRDAVSTAHTALEQCLRQTLAQAEQQIQDAEEKYHTELQQAKESFQALRTEVEGYRKTTLQNIEDTYNRDRQNIERQAAEDRQRLETERENAQMTLQQEHQREREELQNRYQQETSQSRQQYEKSLQKLHQRWREGLASIEAMLSRTADLDTRLFMDWENPFWKQWEITESSIAGVRFGQIQLDCNLLAPGVRDLMRYEVDSSRPTLLPALLAFPNHGSLLLRTQREGRDKAIGLLRAVMLRLLTSLPPGRVHFTIIDPVGLGENFAGFMHATDYEEALVGRRIWTDTAQIQQRLVDLTEHMENVIQKYLRNEFETIEAYNQQAGELAEPYRFLVIADFPVNFNEESAKRLTSIVNSGARCGVYTLIAYDDRQELPAGVNIEDLASNSAYLVHKDNGFVWKNDVYEQFPLELDAPPSEDILTEIVHKVGKAAIDSARVEVPFAVIAPEEGRFWSEDSSQEIHVPIGRCGANRLQSLRLGRGVAQHMLIAGKTGSGKSTLLHVIISNLSLWYCPDQIELYLIDFKRGVEFKTYVSHRLAHARAVAIESDREFGLSILQRLDAEMARRGEMFRKSEVQDLGSYRETTGEILPRTVLIVDEFQVFFSEDDRLAQEAAVLLEQLVRQGRAFGIHVILGSQTLGGASGLARSTMGQMAVRIALQCSEADSQLILDDDNLAARLLSRPGEAIYNDASGMVIGNSPFQTSWLPDEERDQYLNRISPLSTRSSQSVEPMIVFEGNVPADIAGNRQMAELLNDSGWPAPSVAPYAWLGEPVAIKDPTAVLFRRQSGANLLIVGQRDESAMGLMSAAMLGLATQYAPQSAKFIVLDGSPADASLAGYLQRIGEVLPHESQYVEWHDVAEVVTDVASEVQRRIRDDHLDAPAIYILIYSLQRFRILRRDEDEFSFSLGEEAAATPGKLFAEILRDGPTVGVHVIVWADTLATIERTFDRQSVREFDYRVLFQMSAADSSHLVDTPIANQLGYHRALFHSEEKGILERFRPYAPAEVKWLEHFTSQMKMKVTGKK